MNLTNAQIGKIEKFTKKYYGTLDFLHNETHLNGTVKLAEYICKKEGGNKKIVKLGAMIHQFHGHEKILINYLRKLKIDKKTIANLIKMVKFRPHHPQTPPATTIEEKITYDVDALQVLGPFGTLRVFTEKIKQEKNLSKAIKEIEKLQKIFLTNLQTKTAKHLIKKPQKINDIFLDLSKKENKEKYF